MQIDKYLDKVLKDCIIEKYITKYHNRKSDFLKQEMYSTVLTLILEQQDKYLKAKNPLNYIQGIIVHQLNSDNSVIYRLYIRPYRTHVPFIYENEPDTIY